MLGGTCNHLRRYYLVHIIIQQLLQQVTNNILGFHVLTRSDTFSLLTGFSKKKCWKVFEQYPDLIHGVRRDSSVTDVEEFVCRIYRAPNPLAGVNKCRNDLSEKGNIELEKLPPTRDAYDIHLAPSNYQAKISLKANRNRKMVGLPSETGGWKVFDNNLEVVWRTQASIPVSCINLNTCVCTKDVPSQLVRAAKVINNVQQSVDPTQKIVKKIHVIQL